MALGDLLQDCVRKQGWLGRDGVGYTFDTALAIETLSDPAETIAQVVDWLTSGQACTQVQRVGWWSQSYGAHLIKCLPPLARQGRRQFALAIADDLVSQCHLGDRFRIHADSDVTYVHSHCYAMEGLLGLGAHSEVLQRLRGLARCTSERRWFATRMDRHNKRSFPGGHCCADCTTAVSHRPSSVPG